MKDGNSPGVDSGFEDDDLSFDDKIQMTIQDVLEKSNMEYKEKSKKLASTLYDSVINILEINTNDHLFDTIIIPQIEKNIIESFSNGERVDENGKWLISTTKDQNQSLKKFKELLEADLDIIDQIEQSIKNINSIQNRIDDQQEISITKEFLKNNNGRPQEQQNLEKDILNYINKTDPRSWQLAESIVSDITNNSKLKIGDREQFINIIKPGIANFEPEYLIKNKNEIISRISKTLQSSKNFSDYISLVNTEQRHCAASKGKFKVATKAANLSGKDFNFEHMTDEILSTIKQNGVNFNQDSTTKIKDTLNNTFSTLTPEYLSNNSKILIRDTINELSNKKLGFIASLLTNSSIDDSELTKLSDSIKNHTQQIYKVGVPDGILQNTAEDIGIPTNNLKTQNVLPINDLKDEIIRSDATFSSFKKEPALKSETIDLTKPAQGITSKVITSNLSFRDVMGGIKAPVRNTPLGKKVDAPTIQSNKRKLGNTPQVTETSSPTLIEINNRNHNSTKKLMEAIMLNLDNSKYKFDNETKDKIKDNLSIHLKDIPVEYKNYYSQELGHDIAHMLQTKITTWCQIKSLFGGSVTIATKDLQDIGINKVSEINKKIKDGNVAIAVLSVQYGTPALSKNFTTGPNADFPPPPPEVTTRLDSTINSNTKTWKEKNPPKSPKSDRKDSMNSQFTRL